MNPPTTTDIWSLVAVAVLTAIAAFLAAAETGLTRMSRARAMHLREEQRRGSAQLLALVEQPARFLNLVLLLVLVVQFFATALFASVMNSVVGGGLVIAATVMTVITFIGAEVAPKTYAVQHTDRAALFVAPFVYFLTRLPGLGQLTRLLIAIGNVVTPGKGLKSGPFVSEDEIKAMVDEAERDDVIEEEEREMIHSIFEFGDTILREVMVPWPDMVAVPLETPLQEVLELILRTGFSRIPVYDGTIDEVVGLAYAKDVLRRSTTARPTSPGRHPAPGPLHARVDAGRRVPARDAQAQEPHGDRDRRVRRHLGAGHPGGPAGGDRRGDRRRVRPRGAQRRAAARRRLPGQRPPRHRRGQRAARRGAALDRVGLDRGLLFNLVGGVPGRPGGRVPGAAAAAERVQGRRIGRVRIHRLPPPESAQDIAAQARRQ